ncbi:UdgX family uracil-DNA binding protein [Chelatococcus sp. GCM10030263]|uniref:UdgX family uracil-DNA binding protein n=1 Tax=Chelatococcus sp. GCM10030263 TaxID=3273387 RepID=UPI003617B2DD
MRTVALPEDCDEAAFRAAARYCLAERLAPDELVFVTEEAGALFEAVTPADAPPVPVPRSFAKLVPDVLCHSAGDRFALLYGLLWRIQAGERDLMERPTDPAVEQVTRYAKAVTRDTYRMHAFLRFTERLVDGKPIFVAWFEPLHHVLRRAVPFFVDRFRNMDWLIATPKGTAAWNGGVLTFGPPATRPAEGSDAVLDELWTAYYRATFNPARLRVKAMRAQMPKRHWPTMPETAFVPGLVQSAGRVVDEMEQRAPDKPPRFAAALAQRPPVAQAAPATPLDALRREAEGCTLCPLHGPATQTVFGEGPADAGIVFIGEQPGDQEDLEGRPFVGPAGQVFDRALAQAGIDRSRVYVTNAVKHFKFLPRGKRRIHQKPGTSEIRTCRFWLTRELAALRPKLVVALGATAMQGLTGRAVAVTKERGRIIEADGLSVLVTVHPSYLLRLPDADLAEAEFARFVRDLALAKPWCEENAA